MLTGGSEITADLTQVNEWTQRLWDATADIDLSVHQTPTNVESLRTTVIQAYQAGRPIGDLPVEYRPVPPVVLARLETLTEQIQHAEGDLVDLVRHSLRATLGFARALSARTPDAVTAHGTREHRRPEPSLVVAATSILSEKSGSPGSLGPSDPRSVGADKALALAVVVRLIQQVLAALDVHGWTVEVRQQMSARLSVSAQTRQIRIHAESRFSPDQMRGLLVHEVGTHVLRSDNGSAQPLRLLERGLPGYLETEEGLATHHETLVASANDRVRTFALRVLAGDEALRGGFGAVMDRLTDHVSPAEAFPIALRAKRGLSDLTEPGSPLKDIVYLRGLLGVGTHLAAQPLDHPLLMSGKLGLNHLDIARELQADGLLVPAVPRVHDLIEQARQPHPPWDVDGALVTPRR